MEPFFDEPCVQYNNSNNNTKMKQIIFILALIFTSCSSHEIFHERLTNAFNDNENTFIITADDCEYIIFLDNSNNAYFSHRGRCSKCLQRNKK